MNIFRGLGRLLGMGASNAEQTPYSALPANGTASPPKQWELDDVLFYYTEPDRDPFTLRNACEGVQIFGGVGSGKTSGSGAMLARAFLSSDSISGRPGRGGLVCCAKPEEVDLWLDYAEQTGRVSAEDMARRRSSQLNGASLEGYYGDFVIIEPARSRTKRAPWRFNFLDYELHRLGPGAGETLNIVNLLSAVAEIVEGKQEDAGENRFWQQAGKELMRNAVDMVALAGEALTLDHVTRLVLSAPATRDQVDDAKWLQSSYLAECVVKIEDRLDWQNTGQEPYALREENDAKRALDYWLIAFAGLDDRTRSNVIATFRAMVDVLLHGLAWELLGTDTNITPEVTYKKGVVIILNLPVQDYRETGRIVQGIWKLMFQQAMLRRRVAEYPWPVFLWCDEAQNFVSPFDRDYLSAVRSARACTVYLTQNISNYHASLGRANRAHVDTLLGLFTTKIFHAQSDHLTNQYAADLIGKHWTTKKNRSISGGKKDITFSTGEAETLEYKVQPAEFTTLKKGGPANGMLVEAIVSQSGRAFEGNQGETFLRAIFPQA